VQNEVRRYLLGQLEEAEQERIELRLLTDPAFGEEFDTVVDELTDQYVRDELTDEERKRAEEHFLSTPERREKLEFATELLSQADAKRGQRAERSQVATVRPVVQPATPSLLDQIRAFWRQPSYSRLTLLAAVLLVVAGLVFFLLSFGNSSEYMALYVPLSSSDRAESLAPVSAQLAGAGLELNLPLPEQVKNVKVTLKLVDENGVVRDLTIAERLDQTIKVRIPAAWLSRGSYVVHLSMVNADGSEERVRGSYNFVVE
jgi:methionine-rich copper-binding protein CopC